MNSIKDVETSLAWAMFNFIREVVSSVNIDIVYFETRNAKHRSCINVIFRAFREARITKFFLNSRFASALLWEILLEKTVRANLIFRMSL